MRRIFILVLVAFALNPGIRGVAGVDCSAGEDPVGATFRHTAARIFIRWHTRTHAALMAPCVGTETSTRVPTGSIGLPRARDNRWLRHSDG